MPSPGVGLRAWVPSPTLKGILGFCRPGVYFLPATPSSNLLLCVDVLPPNTEVGVLFVSQYLSATSACLEQRECVPV